MRIARYYTHLILLPLFPPFLHITGGGSITCIPPTALERGIRCEMAVLCSHTRLKVVGIGWAYGLSKP